MTRGDNVIKYKIQNIINWHRFFCQNLTILEHNFDFFDQNLNFSTHFDHLKKNRSLEKKFDLKTKFDLLKKNGSFPKRGIFWNKNFVTKFDLMKKSLIFWNKILLQNSIFWNKDFVKKFDFLKKSSIFWKKVRSLKKSSIFWKKFDLFQKGADFGNKFFKFGPRRKCNKIRNSRYIINWRLILRHEIVFRTQKKNEIILNNKKVFEKIFEF